MNPSLRNASLAGVAGAIGLLAVSSVWSSCNPMGGKSGSKGGDTGAASTMRQQAGDAAGQGSGLGAAVGGGASTPENQDVSGQISALAGEEGSAQAGLQFSTQSGSQVGSATSGAQVGASVGAMKGSCDDLRAQLATVHEALLLAAANYQQAINNAQAQLALIRADQQMALNKLTQQGGRVDRATMTSTQDYYRAAIADALKEIDRVRASWPSFTQAPAAQEQSLRDQLKACGG